MQIWEIILIAFSLAMDALAVSVCKGLAGGKPSARGMILCGVWFGVFQAIMPLVGFACASIYSSYIKFITPWISFALLAFLGVKAIIEAIKERKCQTSCRLATYGAKEMALLAIATSIDALAVGVTFAFNGVSFALTTLNNIWLFILLIGVITLIVTAFGNLLGALVGRRLGDKFNFITALLGGIILCALAIKFLVTGIIEISVA